MSLFARPDVDPPTDPLQIALSNRGEACCISHPVDPASLVSTLATIVDYAGALSSSSKIIVMTKNSKRAGDLFAACQTNALAPPSDGDCAKLSTAQFNRMRFLPVDPRAVIPFMNSDKSGSPLLIIDATEGCSYVFERTLELARAAVDVTLSRLILLIGPHDQPSVRSWWPGLPIIESLHQCALPSAAGSPAQATPSRTTLVRRWEGSCGQLLFDGYSPYSTSLFHSPTHRELQRIMTGFEMVGITDCGGALTEMGRFALSHNLPPRLTAMAAIVAEQPHPEKFIPVLCLLDDLPNAKRHPFYTKDLPVGGDGLQSDLAGLSGEFASYGLANPGDTYVTVRLRTIAKLARAVGIEFQGMLNVERPDTRVVAKLAVAGLVDFLAVATGEDRLFASVFFPGESVPRKLYRGTHCGGAALVVGIPHDTFSIDGVPTEPRLAMPTEVTLEIIEEVFPESVLQSSESKGASHLGTSVRMVTVTIGGRAAHLFVRDDSSSTTFTRDHIVESDDTLYVSGMTFSLERGNRKNNAVARCEEEDFTPAARATINIATGPVLLSGQPVSFLVSRDASPIVAESWPDLAKQLV